MTNESELGANLKAFFNRSTGGEDGFQVKPSDSVGAYIPDGLRIDSAGTAVAIAVDSNFAPRLAALLNGDGNPSDLHATALGVAESFVEFHCETNNKHLITADVVEAVISWFINRVASKISATK